MIERDREKARRIERDRERSKEIARDKARSREIEASTEIERARKRSREIQMDREKSREIARDREIERDRGRSRELERDRKKSGEIARDRQGLHKALCLLVLSSLAEHISAGWKESVEFRLFSSSILQLSGVKVSSGVSFSSLAEHIKLMFACVAELSRAYFS